MSTEILTITDLTRMSGDRVCIAGYTPDGACVRPELPYGFFTEPWLIQDSKGIVRPFAKWSSSWIGISRIRLTRRTG